MWLSEFLRMHMWWEHYWRSFYNLMRWLQLLGCLKWLKTAFCTHRKQDQKIKEGGEAMWPRKSFRTWPSTLQTKPGEAGKSNSIGSGTNRGREGDTWLLLSDELLWLPGHVVVYGNGSDDGSLWTGRSRGSKMDSGLTLTIGELVVNGSSQTVAARQGRKKS